MGQISISLPLWPSGILSVAHTCGLLVPGVIGTGVICMDMLVLGAIGMDVIRVDVLVVDVIGVGVIGVNVLVMDAIGVNMFGMDLIARMCGSMCVIS